MCISSDMRAGLVLVAPGRFFIKQKYDIVFYITYKAPHCCEAFHNNLDLIIMPYRQDSRFPLFSYCSIDYASCQVNIHKKIV